MKEINEGENDEEEEEEEEDDLEPVLKNARAPGVALAALFMLPLVAGSKVLNTVEKITANTEI